ncbi:MAG: alpha/beta hydrolase [Clostridia bacterium]|nr:alpha/beta hydrolase [Clostridia bacterium]
MIKAEELILTREWDKVFPKSEAVVHSKVTFVNHFGITLAADMYVPKNANGRLPAVAVSGPFGACKEQSSGLYAQEMAKRGFLAIAFDPSFTGESGGYPRAMHSPDIDVEDFQAAVDFLCVQKNVDPERIGIIGICGWGGMALQTACVDTRIKATVTSTMYDMSRVAGNGYFDAADNEEARHQMRLAVNAQRTRDYLSGDYARQGGVVDPLPEDAPYFVKDYYDYYKTPRGYHPRSLNSNDGWTVNTNTSLMNTRLFTYSKEIRSAVLMIHGDKAHSCYMSRDAYADMVKDSKYVDNKELYIIPGASHTDLYDGGGKDAIPFDKIESFFETYMK